jgi:hypothetical protein
MQTIPAANSGTILSAQIPTRPVFTVRQFAERNQAFSEAALRNLIFKADTRHSTRGRIPGNGLLEAGAIVRIGRKVLIDEAAFFAWLDKLKASATA